ncbi:hypothetical protein PQR46_38950 [Paraburkholderia sediminicola]|uniref:hypothetical protein n=1 Tax=Paraburkholderia TaxID=1822464 RepID=UPI0038B85CAF
MVKALASDTRTDLPVLAIFTTKLRTVAGSGQGSREVFEVDLVVIPTAISRGVGDITDKFSVSAHTEVRVGSGSA